MFIWDKIVMWPHFFIDSVDWATQDVTRSLHSFWRKLLPFFEIFLQIFPTTKGLRNAERSCKLQYVFALPDISNIATYGKYAITVPCN